MAKDRARDPKRVPSLGISDPISHVKVVAPGEHRAENLKMDGDTTYKRWNSNRTKRAERIKSGWMARKGAELEAMGVPVHHKASEPVKISSDPAKGK